jgi:hypothetical protein
MIREDAIRLLTFRTGRKSEKLEDSTNLIEILRRLLLAIDQIAVYIRYNRYSFRQFIQEFRKRKDILLKSDLPEFWDYKKKITGNNSNENLE